MAKQTINPEAGSISFEHFDQKDIDGLLNFFCSHGGQHFATVETGSSDYLVAYSPQPITEEQAQAEWLLILEDFDDAQ